VCLCKATRRAEIDEAMVWGEVGFKVI